MSNLPRVRSYQYAIYTLKLGRVYEITRYNKTNKVMFVKTTQKGFNFLNLDNATVLLQNHMYQTDRTKTIGRKQRLFEINVPDHVSSIRELTLKELKSIKFLEGISFYAPNKTILEEQARRKAEDEEEERLRILEEETISNPLDGMEIT